MSDGSKARILARRARFMTAALTTAGLTASTFIALAQEGCGGEVDGGGTVADSAAEPCLGMLPDDSGFDAGPGPCLTAPPPDTAFEDTRPNVCLSPMPPDTSFDDANDATSMDGGDTSTGDTRSDGSPDGADALTDTPQKADTGPLPCLVPPLDGGE